MGDASAYRPRDWCVTPRLFGKQATVEWLEPDGAVEIAHQASARLQHGFAHRIHHQLLKQEISVREFCAAAGKSYDRMLRVLNGQMVMRLEDIGVADVLLGEVIGIAAGGERLITRQRLGLRPRRGSEPPQQ